MRMLVVMVALGVMMALPEGWRSNGFTLPAHPSRPMNPARTDLSTCSRAQGATCCQPLPTLGQTEAHEARRLRCQLRPPSGQTEARSPGAAKGSLLRRPRPGVGHTLYLPLLPSRAARPRNGIPRCPGQGCSSNGRKSSDKYNDDDYDYCKMALVTHRWHPCAQRTRLSNITGCGQADDLKSHQPLRA